MTCTPERPQNRARLLCTLAAGLLVLAGASQAAPPESAEALIARARDALARGDGIDAEVRLKQAQSVGASREAIAARMGEAMLDQDQPAKAREWLGPGKFAPADAAYGFRMLGRLERLSGNLPAAGRAYDRAIGLAPKDPLLWVDVGYLRYAGGEHLLALDAANYALQLDPGNVRALEFRGRIVRDQWGLEAALPWFEAALERDPDDIAVLGDYAETLGDIGRAGDMLAVTRKMLTLDGGNAKALLLQATLAARAGNGSLARALLNKAGKKLDGVPARMLLDGVIELSSGNNLLAVQALDRLASLQPANPHAQALLAKATYASGDFKGVVRRFGPLAARGDASPYLLTVVARAHEVLGQRDLAAPLLQRAAEATDRPFRPVPENLPIGAMLAEQDNSAAEATAERLRAISPGSADAQAQAGDVQLTLGRAAAAVERYRLVARVRMPESLLSRLVAALGLAGQGNAAAVLVETSLAQTPSSRVAARLAAGHAAGQGDWPRAAQLLDHLRQSGGARDVRLLADLALAQLRDGDAETAEKTAREAYRLQPANPAAATAWGMSLARLKQRPEDARALLDKARAIGGDNPLLAEARKLLVG